MYEKKRESSNWKSIVSALFILLVLAFTIVFLFTNHSLTEIRSLLLSLKARWLLSALGCVFLSYLAEMMCFYELVKKMCNNASILTTFRVTMAGTYFNAITPFAGGGQPFQVSYLMGDGIPMGSCVNIIMIKSIIFQIAVFMTSILSFAFNSRSLNRLVGRFGLFFAIGVCINVLIIFFFGLFLINKKAAKNLVDWVFKLLRKCRIIIRPEKYTKLIENELECFSNGTEIILHDFRLLAKATFYQIINIFFINLIPWFLLISLEGTKGSFFDIITSQAVLKQITAYVPSPGAAGGAEGISYFFFQNFFVNSPIVSVILIWRILTYYLNVVFGGLSLVLVKQRNTKNICLKNIP